MVVVAPAPDEPVVILGVSSTLKLWLMRQEQRGILTHRGAMDLWAQWKKFPSRAAAYFSTGQDILMLQKIAQELGSFGAKVYVKQYQDKAPVIILKGYSGVRSFLTGTKYGLENPKIISMRIGFKGAAASVKEGGVLTIILVSAFDVIDYFLSDKATIADLVGQLASDFIKAAAATGVTLVTLAALTGSTVVSGVAIGPLLAAILIGVGVSLALDAIDQKFAFTDKLKRALNGLFKEAQGGVQASEQSIIDMAAEAVTAILKNAAESLESRAERYFWKTVANLDWYMLPKL